MQGNLLVTELVLNQPLTNRVERHMKCSCCGNMNLKINDSVRHEVFGEGVVVNLSIDNEKYGSWCHVEFKKDTESHRLVDQNTLVVIRSKDLIGPGGAPTRTTILPEEATLRKNYPIASGVLDYFPDALVVISEVSKKGNDQHNPGLPLRWTRSKSSDEADTCIRHFLQRGTLDTDGIRHTAKAAWRMLALLQKEIESEEK